MSAARGAISPFRETEPQRLPRRPLKSLALEGPLNSGNGSARGVLEQSKVPEVTGMYGR